MPVMNWSSTTPAVDPKKPASPKAKTPPSDATSQ
jgi:hypothetical protein